MGKRGPLPKDQAQRNKDNDWRNTPATPKPPAKRPTKPSWLLPEAKKEWNRVSGTLWKMGLLTELDRFALAMYCQQVALYERAQNTMMIEGETYKTPTGQLKQRPEYFIQKDCIKEIRQLCNMFGLSPNSRMRMELPEGDTDEIDEFESMLD